SAKVTPGTKKTDPPSRGERGGGPNVSADKAPTLKTLTHSASRSNRPPSGGVGVSEAWPTGGPAIVQLAREYDWWAWLCRRHLDHWLLQGWQIREWNRPPHAIPC